MVLEHSLWATLSAFVGWGRAGVFHSAVLGLGAACGISMASFLFLPTLSYPSMKTFLRAWIGGMVARVFFLCALMAASWHWAKASQAALLLSYALGVLVFLIIESSVMAHRGVRPREQRQALG